MVFDSSTSSDTATPVSACAGDADAHRYRPIPLTAKAREKHTKLTEGAELPSPLQKFLRPHLRGKSDSIFPVEPQQPAMEMADDESRVRARISVVNSIVKGGETRQKKKPTSGKSVTSAPKISKEDMSKCAEISPFLGKENIGVTATPNVANDPTAPIWAKPAPLSCKKWRSKSKTSFVSPTPFASRDKSIQREVLTVGHAHMITPVNFEKPLNRQLMFTPPSIPKPKCTAGAETGGVSLEAHSIERLQSKEEFQDDGLILDDQTDLHDEVRYDGDAGDNDCGGGDFVVSWTGQIIGDEAAVSWATQSTDKQCEETPCTKKRPGSCRSQNLFILIIVAVLFNPTEYQTLLLLPRPTTEYLATASTKLISAICNEQCFDQSQPLFHRSRLVTECLAATWTKSVSTIFNERCFDPSQSLFHRSRLATECLASASTKFISAIFNEHSFDQIGANGGREAADGRKPTFTLVKSNWTLTETITLVPAGLAFLFWLF